MIDTAVVCLETKAGWSQDIVMERIWWEEIRMNASDFRGGDPHTRQWRDHPNILAFTS